MDGTKGDEVDNDHYITMGKQSTVCAMSASTLMEPFLDLFSFFGLYMKPEANKLCFFCVRSVIFGILVSWTVLGWTVKFSYYLADKQMDIPGWYEVCETPNTEIMNGWVLCFMNSFCYFFILWHFNFSSFKACDVIARICREMPVHKLKKEVDKRWYQAKIFIALDVLFKYGIQATIMAVAPEGERRWETRELGLLIFDTTIMLICFALQATVIMLVACYISLICRLHVVEVKTYAERLQKGVCARRKTNVELAVQDQVSQNPLNEHAEEQMRVSRKSNEEPFLIALEEYNRVIRSVELTSNHLSLFLSVFMLGLLLAWGMFIGSAVGSQRMLILFRAGYNLDYTIPLALMLWNAASVSFELKNLSTKVQPRSDLRETIFLVAQRIQFGYASNQTGFNVLGLRPVAAVATAPS